MQGTSQDCWACLANSCCRLRESALLAVMKRARAAAALLTSCFPLTRLQEVAASSQMASYSIGDESDDEFESQNRASFTSRSRGNGESAPAAGASAGPSSSVTVGGAGAVAGGARGARQPHQYLDDDTDPFGDSYGQHAGSSSHHATGSSNRDRDSARYDNQSPLMYLDDSDGMDYSGGKSANPQGTASDTRSGPGLYGGPGGNNSRYDVYDE